MISAEKFESVGHVNKFMSFAPDTGVRILPKDIISSVQSYALNFHNIFPKPKYTFAIFVFQECSSTASSSFLSPAGAASMGILPPAGKNQLY